MANQCYFNGDFYQCTVATTPGQDPGSTPGSWSLIQLPKKWRFALSRLAYSHLLALDGQTDKAQAERNTAMVTERVGLDDLVREEANTETWLERPVVRGRGAIW